VDTECRRYRLLVSGSTSDIQNETLLNSVGDVLVVEKSFGELYLERLPCDSANRYDMHSFDLRPRDTLEPCPHLHDSASYLYSFSSELNLKSLPCFRPRPEATLKSSNCSQYFPRTSKILGNLLKEPKYFQNHSNLLETLLRMFRIFSELVYTTSFSGRKSSSSPSPKSRSHNVPVRTFFRMGSQLG
jgi:hypothetical protein